MGYRLNRLTEPVFIAVSKLLLTEFGIHCRLESCDGSFNVNCQSITVDNTDFVERKLQLTTTDDPSASKELTHLQFKTWPNYGVPEGPTAIAGFIDHVRQTCHIMLTE